MSHSYAATAGLSGMSSSILSFFFPHYHTVTGWWWMFPPPVPLSLEIFLWNSSRASLCVWEQWCEWALQVPASGCHPERMDCRYSIIISWVIPAAFQKGVRKSFLPLKLSEGFFSPFVLALTLPRPELGSLCWEQSQHSLTMGWCSSRIHLFTLPQGRHCS